MGDAYTSEGAESMTRAVVGGDQMSTATAENSEAYRAIRDALANEHKCSQDDIEELDGWQHIIKRMEDGELFRVLLGELIDALHDELCHEVGQNAHVINRVEDACRELGGNYLPYVGSWFIDSERASVSRSDGTPGDPSDPMGGD